VVADAWSEGDWNNTAATVEMIAVRKYFNMDAPE